MLPLLITPRRLTDDRGWFSETYNARKMESCGVTDDFCQDNQSLSKLAGTLRGLHFQTSPFAQAKLVRCLAGRIFDVAVDIRRHSPTFGRWVGAELSSEDGRQLYVPVGFAHGFLTLEADCMVAYKVNAFYSAPNDAGIAWNDPNIGIEWPSSGQQPLLSEKDAALPLLSDLTADFPYDGDPLAQLREVQL